MTKLADVLLSSVAAAHSSMPLHLEFMTVKLFLLAAIALQITMATTDTTERKDL